MTFPSASPHKPLIRLIVVGFRYSFSERFGRRNIISRSGFVPFTGNSMSFTRGGISGRCTCSMSFKTPRPKSRHESLEQGDVREHRTTDWGHLNNKRFPETLRPSGDRIHRSNRRSTSIQDFRFSCLVKCELT
jgi:hypothetical protein